MINKYVSFVWLFFVFLECRVGKWVYKNKFWFYFVLSFYGIFKCIICKCKVCMWLYFGMKL